MTKYEDAADQLREFVRIIDDQRKLIMQCDNELRGHLAWLKVELEKCVIRAYKQDRSSCFADSVLVAVLYNTDRFLSNDGNDVMNLLKSEHIKLNQNNEFIKTSADVRKQMGGKWNNGHHQSASEFLEELIAKSSSNTEFIEILQPVSGAVSMSDFVSGQVAKPKFDKDMLIINTSQLRVADYETITASGTQYDIHAVVCLVGNHYIAHVRAPYSWMYYDDLFKEGRMQIEYSPETRPNSPSRSGEVFVYIRK